MDNALYYLALNRQRGLSAEMTTIANNIANAGTAGYQREGVLFQEFVVATEDGESISMGDLNARFADDLPGPIETTGAAFDFAIEGEGYFMIDDGEEVILTRAGGFQRSPAGLLVTPDGLPVLDAGQAPIFLPADAGQIQVASDGTISADGQPLGQIGVVTAPEETLERLGRIAFRPNDGIDPVANPRVRQGAIEASNVNTVEEVARMIEVTRAYETVQSIIEDEDARIRETIETLGRSV
ncbi:MAG: flagellar hook-basal body complex protein [Pseudomonadota bacterium]